MPDVSPTVDSVPLEIHLAQAQRVHGPLPVAAEHALSGARPRGHVPTADEVTRMKSAVADDVRTLRALAAEGRFDERSQAGAELEYVIVNGDNQPHPAAHRILAQCDWLQPELSLYNLEATSKPVPVGRDFLDQMEADLRRSHVSTQASMTDVDGKLVLIGILPTYAPEHFTPDFFVNDRYHSLNATLLSRSKSKTFNLHFDGPDQIRYSHPAILIQALNTSFQLHLSAGVDKITQLYNLIQLVTGPLVAVAANSPLVMGQRGWAESRIPVWDGSTDPRSAEPKHVLFGDKWITDPFEHFDALADFSPLLVKDEYAGGIECGALRLLNGHVWRWNRICYGVEDGVSHLRVEARALPAGPTFADMTANAAFFYGLVIGLRDELGTELPEFKEASDNFFAGARDGLNAKFQWFGVEFTAPDLIRALLPIAERGLRTLEVPVETIERFLGIIKGRADTGQNGADWLRKEFEIRQGLAPLETVLAEVTAEYIALQEGGTPVHSWPHEGVPAGIYVY